MFGFVCLLPVDLNENSKVVPWVTAQSDPPHIRYGERGLSSPV
jgi:hypothetical protein